MKKLLLKALLLTVPVFGFGQIFQEDFDGAGPGISAWTVIDNDGQTPAQQVSFITNGWNSIDRAGANGNFGGPAGNHAAMSTSWYDPAGASDDWLISPQVAVSGTTPILVWQAKALDPNFADGYKVMLSTNGGNTIADFTVELYSTAGESGTWVERNVDLTPYIGKNIRFAFVNNSDDKLLLLVDNISVVNSYTAPATLPCPNMTLPADGATGVEYLSGTSLSWDAVAGAGNYGVYLGTTPSNMVLLGNTTYTDVSVSDLSPNTTYYWKVTANNIGGESVGCATKSFKTTDSPTAPYCGPLTFADQLGDGDEPITLVNFAGINNTTDNTPYIGNYHEVFLDQVATVMQGFSYDITLKGNTVGDFSNSFTVFIDWNQDHDFNDAGETYQVAQPLSNSNGIDAAQVIQSISVPMNAAVGNTRMRIVKVYGSTPPTDACSDEDYGQAEDYTVNIKPYVAPTAAPACPTLNTPANAATNISYYPGVTLNWTAATTGGAAESYDVYLDTKSNPTTLLGNTASTTYTATGLLPSTTYYWKVIAKNSVGASSACSVYSFTTANPSYCTAGATSVFFEKITNVTFADINNNSLSTAGYEDFTSIVGNVTAGQTYTFTATDASDTYSSGDQVLVWIDFNHDLDFNDAGEQVLVTPEQPSTWGGSITIPSDAMPGATRMRVRMHDTTASVPNATPCGNSTFGQVEDYTLNITAKLGVNDTNIKQGIKVYPNPVTDVMTIDAPSKVKSVAIYDAGGKLVKTADPGATKSEVNLSGLASGVYFVTAITENGPQSFKVIKK